MDKFIVLIWRGKEASLRGPYASERGRIRGARRQRARDNALGRWPNMKVSDGLFRLDVGRSHRGTKVEIRAFSGRELEGA